MNLSMFQRASVRLTALYLLIIMSISLIFSFGLYQLASREIEQGIRRPNSFAQIIRLNNLEGLQDFVRGQENAISDAKRNIKISLGFINLFILVSGGLLSYFLARRTLRPIERAHEAQSRFTSDASHELRTPIAAMRLENELSLTDPKLSIKQAKKQLESNIEELDKLTSLTEGLLQLARLENEQLDTSLCKLDHIVSQAIKRNQAEIDTKKQNILWKKEKIEVITNEEALITSVAVLINNASKYSPEKSTITIVTQKNRHNVIIKVTDNGIGINQIELHKIFDRFYRADDSRTKETHDSYGIGLSIAKKSITALGGNITVQSAPKKGSTFTISLPCRT